MTCILISQSFRFQDTPNDQSFHKTPDSTNRPSKPQTDADLLQIANLSLQGAAGYTEQHAGPVSAVYESVTTDDSFFGHVTVDNIIGRVSVMLEVCICYQWADLSRESLQERYCTEFGGTLSQHEEKGLEICHMLSGLPPPDYNTLKASFESFAELDEEIVHSFLYEEKAKLEAVFGNLDEKGINKDKKRLCIAAILHKLVASKSCGVRRLLKMAEESQLLDVAMSSGNITRIDITKMNLCANYRSGRDTMKNPKDAHDYYAIYMKMLNCIRPTLSRMLTDEEVKQHK